MSNVFILNGVQPYGFAPGKLNASFVERAARILSDMGHTVRVTASAEDYDVDTEVENHQWADTVIMQFPVNWMGAPWSFKKYMDEVYTAGMDGWLCNGDGLTADAPKRTTVWAGRSPARNTCCPARSIRRQRPLTIRQSRSFPA